jgi:hypothetical protein
MEAEAMSTTLHVVVAETASQEAHEIAALKKLQDLMAKVDRDKPDPKALQQFRSMLDTKPQVVRALCNLAQENADKVLKTIASGTLAFEAVTRDMRLMREDMGYTTAPELERTLIDHVVLCWLRLQRAELAYTQVFGATVTLEQARHWERKLTAAQTRYLRACETLARVRRLSRSTPLQVNIGAQQVNVAGDP